MENLSCDVLVLGAGPGGYVAALRASQLGLDTVIVEGETPGGTCLSVGCIPSKALIHAAAEYHRLVEKSELDALGISAGEPALDLARTQSWKDGIVRKLTGGVAGLLKKAGVRPVAGWGVMQDGKTCLVPRPDGSMKITAKNIILATGSEAVELSHLPFGGNVLSSTQALELDAVPETLAVVGGGYIGLELGSAFASFGAKVTIIEATDRLLPLYDADLVRPVIKSLENRGVEIFTSAKATGRDGNALVIRTADGAEKSVAAEKALVTVGRRARLDGWGRENLALDMDGGHVRIDVRCQTAMSGVFAIGDLTGEPMLAHRAMAQAATVAEIIAGKPRIFDPAAIPAICFTDPEIVTVGLSKHQAEADGYDDVTVGKFPLAANGRALTMQAGEGFVRITADNRTGQVLGLDAVGRGVSELAADFSLALEMGTCLEDVSATIHAHPTLGEAIQEASLIAQGRSLHL